jgi:hypothetical protein
VPIIDAIRFELHPLQTLAAFGQLSIRGLGEISDADSEPSVLLARTDAVPVPARPISHHGELMEVPLT